MGWHRSGTVQELNTPARREQAQSPRGAAMRVLRCVHTGVCSRGVHSGVCAQVCSQVCVLRYGSQGRAHRGVHSGVCAQVREERTQGFCK